MIAIWGIRGSYSTSAQPAEPVLTHRQFTT